MAYADGARQTTGDGLPREITKASLAAAFGVWIGFLFGTNAMISSTNSNFLAVLPDALHVSRTAISGALAASVWLVAIILPFSGRVMDRFGIRTVILPGALLFAACYIGLGQIHTFWQFAAVQVVLALTVAMHGSVGYAKLISLWFDRNRGLMLGLCVALGAGVGQTIMPRVSRWMIDSYGWRGGYVGIGLMVLIIAFPLLFLFARPPAKAALIDGVPEAVVEKIGMTFGEALKTRELYLIVFAIMLGSFSLIGTLQHMVPMLLERHFTPGPATTAISVAFLGVVLGEFTTGFLVDRINSSKIILPYFVLALVGVLLVHSTTDGNILLAGALLMGLGLGCEVGLNAYLVSRYFGLKSFGTLYGLTFGASNFGIGIGIFLMGWLRDLTGSYDVTLWVVGVTMTLAILCVLLLGPFRYAKGNSLAGVKK